MVGFYILTALVCVNTVAIFSRLNFELGFSVEIEKIKINSYYQGQFKKIIDTVNSVNTIVLCFRSTIILWI